MQEEWASEREREGGRKKSKSSKNKDGGACAQFAFDAIKSLHQLLRQWTTADETRRATMRRVGANETKRDETISLTVAAFNVGTRRGGGVKDRERGGTDGRQTGAISRLDLPLILSVKSCNACACMQYTDTHKATLTYTHMHA